MKDLQTYHLPLTALDGRVSEGLLAPLEPLAPLTLMVLGSVGVEVLIKAENGWGDLVDGHTFREGWPLSRLALDLRDGGTALAVAAQIVRLVGAKAPPALEAFALTMRIACEAPDQRARWATRLTTLALAQLAPKTETTCPA